MSKPTAFVLLTAILPMIAGATEYPPADHGGGSLTLSNGDVIWGEHTNIHTFTIPAGATVTVKFYDGTSTWEQSNTPTGTLLIDAEHIVIDGHLSGDGAGYSGGGGGGGGGTYQWPGGAPGLGRYQFHLAGGELRGDGGNGSFQCGFGCGSGTTFSSGIGGPGDGYDWGGTGGVSSSEWWKACGGYRSGWKQGTNGDTTTDESIVMGSGGAGGPGGFGGFSAQGQVSGEGGAAGGSGGGAVALVGRLSLHLSGSGRVTANGTMGGPMNVDPPSPGLTGRKGADAFPYDPSNRPVDTNFWHLTGGSGAGGGILLKCETLGGMVFDPGATISNVGGGGMIQNGGTVKLFYIGSGPSESGVNIYTGRKFRNSGASSAEPNWMMYE